jgi:hypothetical protein
MSFTGNTNDEVQEGPVFQKVSGSVDIMMKASQQVDEAMAVISQYLNVEQLPEEPTWNKLSAARRGMPTILVDVAEACAVAAGGKTTGGKYDRVWGANQKRFSNMIFDDLVSGEGAKGTVVLDIEPQTLGRPHMGSFSGAKEADREPTIVFTGIPEASPMYDDDTAACWALWSVPTCQPWTDPDGREVFQPSRVSPNVYGVIRTFATRQDCIDAELELRQAIQQFTRNNPDFIQQQDAMRNAEQPPEHVDPLTGEILRQTRRVQEHSEMPF